MILTGSPEKVEKVEKPQPRISRKKLEKAGQQTFTWTELDPNGSNYGETQTSSIPTQTPKELSISIAALSDTHTWHRKFKVPDADVFVFAGDLMGSGYKHVEVVEFFDWLDQLPHKYKIIVAGNHDRLFESNERWCLDQSKSDVARGWGGIMPPSGGTVYLRDAGVTINGFNFWGSPVQPWFHHWAFNVPRGAAIKEYWDKIPFGTDVLITHGPPYGVLDQIVPEQSKPVWSNIIHLPTEHLGCEELAKRIVIVKPKVCIFGHIHGGYGSLDRDGTSFHNVSVCNEAYEAVNPPHLITVSR